MFVNKNIILNNIGIMETFLLENWTTLLSVLLIIISNVITFLVHHQSSKRLTTLESTPADQSQADESQALIMKALNQILEVLNEKKDQ